MHIGILGTRGIPNRYGGFEECAEKLALGLVAKGHTVTVYNSRRHEFQGTEWNGVRIVHCADPEHKIGTAGQFIYDLNCINDARGRNFDIALHLGYTSSSVWWWRWPRKARNIVNMDGLEWKRSKFSPKVQRFLQYAESLAARNAQALVSDSIGIQQYLQEKYGKASTFIPYGAHIPGQIDPSHLERYGLQPGGYFMLIARMEPENNIEMIIRGYLGRNDSRPLLVVGGTGNEFGGRMKREYGQNSLVRFTGGIYDAAALNALRFHSALYFHGHSVGGTNPSLLEAMASGARIAAHKNPFNAAVLGADAAYFSSETEVAGCIAALDAGALDTTGWVAANLSKISEQYNWPRIVDEYEALMLQELARR